MAEFVINEVDIFKYVVSENENNTVSDALANAKKLISRISLNIFEDEYFIMYEMLRAITSYDMAFSSDALYQVLLNNRGMILESSKVTISEDVKDPTERFDQIATIVMAEYSDLAEEDLEEHTFNGNMELYVKSWAEVRFEEILYTVQLIRTEGHKVGRDFLRGTTDANYYYQRSWEVVKGLLEGDANLLAEIIDTSIQTPDEIADIHDRNETIQEPLCMTGIETLDKEMTGVYKGEMYTIQAGSGVGKSRFAAGAFAKNAVNNGKNVLFISLEQKSSRVFDMFHARHIFDTTGKRTISDREIIRSAYSPMEEAVVKEASIDLIENQKLGRLRIEGRQLKAVDVPMFLDQVWEEFQFDMVVLDYIGLLTIEKERYVELTNCINWLKDACKFFKGQGFALVVPNQLSNEANKDLVSGRTELASLGGSESAYIFRGSDVVLTLFADDEMKKDKELDIHIPKMRLGELTGKIRVHSEFGICSFTDIERHQEAESFFDL